MEGRRESFGEPAPLSAAQRWKSSRDDGIIARAVNQIFETLDKAGNEFSVRVSHLELYNEELRDLLNPANKALKLYEDASSGGRVIVHSLEEKVVYTPQDIFEILQKSWEERETAATEMNPNSSRSHCIFSITIHMKEGSPEGEDLIKIGKLNLVDLAGSENIGRSGADKVQSRKQEACMINKSLLTLGRVITSLVENSPHIPYRESKLTRLLQDSLGGTTKTCIVATISPASGSFDETLSTLDYAYRAKSIKNRPECNAKMSKREVMKEFTQEIHVLKAQLDAMRRKDGVYLPTDQFAQMEVTKKEQEERIQFCEDLIQQKEKELLELQEMFDRQGAQLDRTQTKLTETTEVLSKTTDKLATTENSLVEVRETLNEHKYMLNAHEDTEVRFHDEATQVIEVLDESVADISKLFAKIDRKGSMEELNTTHLARLREVLEGDVTQTQEAVSKFIADQQVRCSEFRDGVQSFADEQTSEIGRSIDQIEELQAYFLRFLEESSGRTSSFLESATENSNGVVRNDRKFETQLTCRVQNFSQSATASGSSLVETAKAKQEDIATWTAGRESLLNNDQDTLRIYLGRHMAHLKQTSELAASSSRAQIQELEKSTRQLQEFVQAQEEENRKFQTELMAKVASLISGYCDQSQAATKSAVASIVAAFNSSTIETKRSAENVADAIRIAESETASFGTGASNSIERDVESTRQMSYDYSVFVSEHTEEIRRLEKLIEEFREQTIDALQRRTAERAEEIGASIVQQGRYVSEQDTSKIGAVQETRNRVNLQIAQAHRQQEALRMFSQQASSDISSRKSELSNFHQDYSAFSATLRGQLEKVALEQYQATGATPQKKDICFPRNLAKTKPKDALLAEYRRQRATGANPDDILQRPDSPMEPTSTSTIIIDDDIPLEVPQLDESAKQPEATPPQPATVSMVPKMNSQAKLPVPTAAAKPPTKTMGPQKATAIAPARSNSTVQKKPIAPANSKKLVRNPSKTGLQEITNK